MTSFILTKLVVGDLELCSRFYEAIAPFKSVARLSANVAGRDLDEIIYADAAGGSPRFGLVSYRGEAKTPTGEVELCFRVDSVDEAIDLIRANGGTVKVEPYVSTGAGQLRVAFALDPEGHVIELVQSL